MFVVLKVEKWAAKKNPFIAIVVVRTRSNAIRNALTRHYNVLFIYIYSRFCRLTQFGGRFEGDEM